MSDLNIRTESINQEKNTGSKFLDIGFGEETFTSDTKSKGNKRKNKQVEGHQTEISAWQKKPSNP